MKRLRGVRGDLGIRELVNAEVVSLKGEKIQLKSLLVYTSLLPPILIHLDFTIHDLNLPMDFIVYLINRSFKKRCLWGELVGRRPRVLF